jgi:tRNA(Ile)-lysidine synthase
MATVFEKFIGAIKKHHLVNRGDTVALAVSGGADSVALLYLFLEIKSAWCLNLVVAHYNHQLRGAESEEDETFTQELADTHHLECYVESNAITQQSGNLEEQLRQRRYAFFARLASSLPTQKVALGHTLNDQAETLLMRLLRGSGTAGLAAIPPIREELFIRPLLGISREEIVRYLKTKRQGWREDSSNATPQFLRNKIRHDLIPKLQSQFNPQIVSVLANTAAILHEDAKALQFLAAGFLQTHQSFPNPSECILPVEALFQLPRGFAKLILGKALHQLAPGLKPLSSKNLEAIYSLLVGQKSGKSFIKGNVTVRRQFQSLIFERTEDPKLAAYSYRYSLPIPGEVVVPEAGVRYLVWQGKEADPAPSSKIKEVYLTSAEVESGFQVRNWQAGDVYLPLGNCSEKKVKELFSRAKIPLHARSAWPVVTVKGKILLVKGFAVSADFNCRLTPARILRVLVEEIEVAAF